jgi:hypothetical protein
MVKHFYVPPPNPIRMKKMARFGRRKTMMNLKAKTGIGKIKKLMMKSLTVKAFEDIEKEKKK